MANHCYNYVEYRGADAPLVYDMFKKLETINREEGMGALPDIEGIDKQQGRFFFDVELLNEDTSYVHVRFWTKWSPPMEEMIDISKHYLGTWEMEVEELNMGIFGKVMFDNEGNYTEVYLDDEVFNNIEETDDYQWKYKGKIYESDYEIYEEELKRLLSKSVI